MSKIIKQDTQGTKPLLQVGELGYDNYTAGGDVGRVYVGTGGTNIALAKKAEVTTVDGKADTHISRVDNPHAVTKAQVGLSNVDNTADNAKSVLSASKLTTARTINGVAFDGTANITVIDSTKLPVGGKAADSNLLDGMDPSSSNVGNTIVARDVNGNFSAGLITGTVTKADKWTTPRTITLDGDITGSVSVDGSQNVTINTQLNMDILDYVNARDYYVIPEVDDTGSIQRALATGKNVKLDGIFTISSGGFSVGLGGVPQLIFGMNPRADRIRVNFNDGTNIFNLMSDYASLTGIGFEMVSGMKTSGSYVAIVNPTRKNIISNFKMQHCAKGISIDAEAVITVMTDGEIADATSGTGIGIFINGGNDTFISRVVMDSSGVEPLAGIRIKRTQSVFISDVDIIDFGNPLLIDPDNSVSDLVTWCFFNSLACDTSSGHGIKIAPSGGVTVKGLFFDNCWSASNTLKGAYITASDTAIVDGVFFDNCSLIQNSEEGLLADGNVANIEFNNGRVSGNGGGSKVGIRFGSTINGFAVRGSRIGAIMGMPVSQTYGIIADGNPNNFIIDSNNLTGNITNGDLISNITLATNSSHLGNIGTTVGNYRNGKKIWDESNDGAGSGLDADLLDGKHADEFMKTGYCQADLNTMATAGSYSVQTGHLNMPSGVDNGNMLVLRTLTADSFAQIITDYQSNNIYWRSGSTVGWKAWRRILSDGNALTTSPLGYASGAGGVVTQLTSKSTTVTLNRICGSITTSNSALAAGATATFIMNNTLIEQYDEITLTPFYGSVLPVNYRIEVYGYGLGIAYIRITNISGGSLSEAVTFRFSIKKGAIT